MRDLGRSRQAQSHLPQLIGLRVHLLRGAVKYHPAVRQGNHAIHFSGLLRNLRHRDRRHLGGIVQFLQNGQQSPAARRIQQGRGLIQKQVPRPHCQHAGQGQSLPLPS